MGTEPEITSVFPLGGQPGASVDVQIRGHNLTGAYAVWSARTDFQARIDRVETVVVKKEGQEAAEKSPPPEQVLTRLQIDPSLSSGPYPLRIVAPVGVSNALDFWVQQETPTRETDRPHSDPKTAQRLSVPVAVDGVVAEAGEVDCYEFEAIRGQELVFEVNPQPVKATLYQPGGSWFQPDRVVRLDFDETLLPRYRQFSQPRTSYRFPRTGRYLLRLSSGTENAVYRLRIADLQAASPAAHTESWQERSFLRRLSSSWLRRLWDRGFNPHLPMAPDKSPGASPSRRVQFPGTGPATQALALVKEIEPNDDSTQAPSAPVPLILEGSVERPGDLDHLRFAAQAGQSLVFEIETSKTPYPYFNPKLLILDSEGREVFDNIYNRTTVQTMIYWKSTEAKTRYTFLESGEYTLQVRDVTSRHGDPNFRYRVMIRPEIPHVGEVQVIEYWENRSDVEIDRVNLRPGEVKKLTVVIDREEGFDGDVVLTADRLPAGVKILPGTEVEQPRGVVQDEGLKKRFQAYRRQTLLFLVAEEGAPPTVLPHTVRLLVQPVGRSGTARYVKYTRAEGQFPIDLGQTGGSLLVREIPVTVVASSSEQPPARPELQAHQTVQE